MYLRNRGHGTGDVVVWICFQVERVYLELTAFYVEHWRLGATLWVGEEFHKVVDVHGGAHDYELEWVAVEV